MHALEDALSRRNKNRQAQRIFHGPTEGKGLLQHFSIDQLGDHAWITHWGNPDTHSTDEMQPFIQKHFQSAVLIDRPEKGLPDVAQPFWGTPPAVFAVSENELRYEIRLQETRHPGLFLDHRPLREWLASQSLKEKTVLNGFAYTGSLSVAAAQAGATVTTVDLSKPSLQWAKKNFELNTFALEKNRFISEDYFQFLKRSQNKAERFDLVVADPPSFSRSDGGVFSTQKDLERLFLESAASTRKGGILIISINSERIPRREFEKRALEALKASYQVQILFRIQPPEDFPVNPQDPASDYLKGLALQLHS